jgi:hypothetical protein
VPISTLIPSGTTAAASADTTLVDGAVATLVLAGEGAILVEAKTVAGAYITVQSLTTKTPVQKVYGPLVFRTRREVVQPTFAPGGIAPTVPPVGVEVYTDAPLGSSGSPVSVAPSVAMGAGAVTADTQRTTTASDSPDVSALNSIDGKVLTNAQLVAALAAALIKTEPLGRLGIAHEITAAATASTTLALQPDTVRLRLSARGANCRVAIGTGAQTASVTTNTTNSHFLADGASMDVACLPGSQISVIRGADQTANGTVHVSELV